MKKPNEHFILEDFITWGIGILLIPFAAIGILTWYLIMLCFLIVYTVAYFLSLVYEVLRRTP